MHLALIQIITIQISAHPKLLKNPQNVHATIRYPSITVCCNAAHHVYSPYSENMGREVFMPMTAISRLHFTASIIIHCAPIMTIQIFVVISAKQKLNAFINSS